MCAVCTHPYHVQGWPSRPAMRLALNGHNAPNLVQRYSFFLIRRAKLLYFSIFLAYFNMKFWKINDMGLRQEGLAATVSGRGPTAS